MRWCLGSRPDADRWPGGPIDPYQGRRLKGSLTFAAIPAWEGAMAEVDRALCNPGLLGRVLDCVRAHAVPGTDLATMTREDLRHIAGDLALAESALLSLSVGARDNTVLMERMMLARSLDPDEMRHASSMALRDAERVCSQCR